MSKFAFYNSKIYKQTFKPIACIMKLSIVFLLICFQVTAKTTGQKITLNVQNEKLGKVLKAIEQQTSYRFIYSNRVVPVNKQVSLSAIEKDLHEVLNDLLQNFNLAYREENGKLIVIFQESKNSKETRIGEVINLVKTVSGTITNENNAPLEGVSIIVKGTNFGTTTNSAGYFKLEAADNNAILLFSYSGYLTTEVSVKSKTVINVSMVLESKSLGDVVLVAYGNSTRKTSTGASQTLKAKELSDLPVAQFTQKLQGKFAGVQINQATGKPGLGMQVRIRGQASISAGSDPLYVVDGFPIAGDINNINPDELETITVLKDASATSLYGSRAANGVVLITTKRGKVGQTTTNVSTYYGTQEVPQQLRPDLMNGTEFAQYKKEYYEDLGQPVPSEFQNPSQYGKGTDWYGAMLRTAPIQNYSVTVNAGSDRFKTSTTAGFFNQDGVLRNSNFKRFSLRLNADYKLSEKINLGFNLSTSNTINNTPGSDGIFYSNFLALRKGGLLQNASLAWPIIPYKNPDGTLPLTAYIPGVSAFPAPNWYKGLTEIKNETKTNRLLSNAFITYEPIKGLTIRSSINVDLAQENFYNFKPSTASINFTEAPPNQATSLKTNDRYSTWLTENLVTYKKTIHNDHNFELLGGYTVQKYRKDYDQLFLTGFPDDRISTTQSAQNIDRPNTFNDIQEWSLISYLFRLTYNYKGKYLFGASIRRDGSSKFGTDNKWGNFPSLAAGWVVSDEDFMNKIKAVSFLKLRASYGETGNNNIGNYTQYASVSTTTNTVFANNIGSGASITHLGNKNLGWEVTKQIDGGLELGLFKDRITFMYDYYTKKTENLLYNVNVPQESGFSSFTTNVGEVKFWGHEFTISTRNMVKAFKWNTDFNISFNQSKVIKLAEGIDRLYGNWPYVGTIIAVGHPINQFMASFGMAFIKISPILINPQKQVFLK